MHSHIENMPKLAYIADSLCNIYPELLIVSAGDNRTGNAYNDKYNNQKQFNLISFNGENEHKNTSLLN